MNYDKKLITKIYKKQSLLQLEFSNTQRFPKTFPVVFYPMWIKKIKEFANSNECSNEWKIFIESNEDQIVFFIHFIVYKFNYKRCKEGESFDLFSKTLEFFWYKYYQVIELLKICGLIEVGRSYIPTISCKQVTIKNFDLQNILEFNLKSKPLIKKIILDIESKKDKRQGKKTIPIETISYTDCIATIDKNLYVELENTKPLGYNSKPYFNLVNKINQSNILSLENIEDRFGKTYGEFFSNGKKEYRDTILLNGQKIQEIDLGSSHLFNLSLLCLYPEIFDHPYIKEKLGLKTFLLKEIFKSVDTQSISFKRYTELVQLGNFNSFFSKLYNVEKDLIKNQMWIILSGERMFYTCLKKDIKTYFPWIIEIVDLLKNMKMNHILRVTESLIMKAWQNELNVIGKTRQSNTDALYIPYTDSINEHFLLVKKVLINLTKDKNCIIPCLKNKTTNERICECELNYTTTFEKEIKETIIEKINKRFKTKKNKLIFKSELTYFASSLIPNFYKNYFNYFFKLNKNINHLKNWAKYNIINNISFGVPGILNDSEYKIPEWKNEEDILTSLPNNYSLKEFHSFLNYNEKYKSKIKAKDDIINNISFGVPGIWGPAQEFVQKGQNAHTFKRQKGQNADIIITTKLDSQNVPHIFIKTKNKNRHKMKKDREYFENELKNLLSQPDLDESQKKKLRRYRDILQNEGHFAEKSEKMKRDKLQEIEETQFVPEEQNAEIKDEGTNCEAVQTIQKRIVPEDIFQKFTKLRKRYGLIDTPIEEIYWWIVDNKENIFKSIEENELKPYLEQEEVILLNAESIIKDFMTQIA